MASLWTHFGHTMSTFWPHFGRTLEVSRLIRLVPERVHRCFMNVNFVYIYIQLPSRVCSQHWYSKWPGSGLCSQPQSYDARPWEGQTRCRNRPAGLPSIYFASNARKEKTTPFGVNLMRRHVLDRAAQDQQRNSKQAAGVWPGWTSSLCRQQTFVCSLNTCRGSHRLIWPSPCPVVHTLAAPAASKLSKGYPNIFIEVLTQWHQLCSCNLRTGQYIGLKGMCNCMCNCGCSRILSGTGMQTGVSRLLMAAVDGIRICLTATAVISKTARTLPEAAGNPQVDKQ